MSVEGMNSGQLVEEILASGRIPDQLAATVSRFVSKGTDRDHMLRLLNAYLRHPEWESDFEQGLRAGDEFPSLYDKVYSLIARGADAEEMRYRLEIFHLQLVSQDRDDDDDVVLEVLDGLVGF